MDQSKAYPHFSLTGANLSLSEQVCPRNERNCRAVEELSLLFDISYTLESSFELRDVVRPVLQRMSDVMGMRRGAITILNRQRGQLAIGEVCGLPAGKSSAQYLAECREIIDHAMQKGQAVIVPDIAREAALQARCQTEAVRPGTPIAFLCVPIKFGDEILGSLSVERETTAATSLSADRRLLSLIANIVAQTVHFHRVAQEKFEALQQENNRLQEQIKSCFRPSNIVGNSHAMRTVYLHIEQVANSTTTVLIRGESGTGKELVARALHQQSQRQHKCFLKFNCAALPESIIESELFGHEKGAFTGALAMRKGRFEVANGGTIFLDEIGDISPATQVKLLRVLQEKEFERVGGHTPIPCDVRIIAATSRNLEQMIETGAFRSDLYYRLNVFPIYLPPLRDRKSDLLLLADTFVEKFGAANGKHVRRISTAAIDLLMSYHWPGNVRELENCIERAVLLCQGQSIEAQHLPPTLQKKEPSEATTSTLEAALAGLEYEMIVAELKNCAGNMCHAARNLGITERQIGLRVKTYNIDTKRFRKTSLPPNDDVP